MLDVSLAIGHHLLIFSLFGVLVAELVLVCPTMEASGVGRVARIDLWYGILAAFILVLGFSRAIFAAKGWAYYQHNAFFWAKITTFLLIGILSVPPTVSYIHWQRAGSSPTSAQVARVRLYLWAETVLFALLPIFAAAMHEATAQTRCRDLRLLAATHYLEPDRPGGDTRGV